MNAPRKSGGILSRFAGASAASSLIAVMLILVAGGLAAWFGWQRWSGEIIEQTSYTLQAEDIVVTPPPPWIHADVKSEVVRTGSLQDLRILDPDLALQIQQAFALHAWVADVRRVRKRFPPQVLVDLEYRRPVAMVTAATGGYWPVDAEGVLLPPEEFSPEQTRHFLRVIVENSQPAGPAGTPYGDQRIIGAARIAALLHNYRDEIGVETLVVNVTPDVTGADAEPTYEMYTPARCRIIWGCAPGREGAGEVTGSEKLARLRAFVTQRGPIDQENGPSEIDLRDARGIGVMKRTAHLEREPIERR